MEDLMKSKLIKSVMTLLALSLYFNSASVHAAPVVILKADDLTDPSASVWESFFNVIQTQNIKASVGIIAKDFSASAQNINTVRNLYASGRFEFWNHGYDHKQYQIPSGAQPTDASADYDGDNRTDYSVKANDGSWSIDYAANGFGGCNALWLRKLHGACYTGRL
jgi:peptidoglycan/xylan/chitin deacetylase (PgdA/CDA1 family)